MTSDDFSVIIPAGGRGRRTGTKQLKQFALLNQKPVIVHTIEKFRDFDKTIKIYVALPDFAMVEFKAIQKEFLGQNEIITVQGGENRFQSVRNTLKQVFSNYIAVHDAVRPLVSVKLIKRTFEEAQKQGNAIPAILLHDSLRKVSELKNTAIDRSNYRLIQTPQIFESKQLTKAYQQNFNKKFTDDASVVEAAGIPIHLIEGERINLKITYPEDFVIAESLVNYKL